MGSRLDLHDILKAIIGSSNVYFQPPEDLKMKYPCIIYTRNKIDTKYAGDKVYNHTIGYTVTVIDSNPDSLIPEKLLTLPKCTFDRHYTADNLHHDTFTIYY